MSIITRFFTLILFLASQNANADLPIFDIGKLSWYKNSPLLGIVALQSGILRNIRLFGHYGPQKEEFLCQREIANPVGVHESTANKDCPQDNTTAIIQQLFPSPTRGQLSLPGPDSDFFNQISGDQIAKILEIYEKYKETKESEEAHKAFQGLFYYILGVKEGKKDNISIKAFNSNQKKGLAKIWGLSKEKKKLENNEQEDILKNLADAYAKLFFGALKEQNKYPPNTIEAALLALAWKRSDKIQDLENLLKGNENPGNDLNNTSYLNWKKEAMDRQNLSSDAFKKLLENKPALIFNTIAFDFYEAPFPPLLGTGSATYAEAKDFSDCGESSLRNFFNIVLANTKNRRFETNNLSENFPESSVNLQKFYTEIQPTYESVVISKMRDEWASVVSGLNKNNKEMGETIDYRNKDICNIAGIGADNMLAVLVRLLNNTELTEMWKKKPKNEKEKEGGIRRAEMMNFIFAKFSRDDFELNWKNQNGKSDSLPDFSTMTIFVNHTKRFEWKFNSGHFEFTNISEAQHSDWRKKNNTALPLLLKDLKDLVLRDWLFPFYFSDNSNDYLEAKKEENIRKELASTLVYALKIDGSENRLKAIDTLINLGADQEMKALVPLWLNSLTDDTALNGRIVGLIFAHKDFFTEDYFTEENFPRIFKMYTTSWNELEKDFPENSELYWNKFSEKLLMYIYGEKIKPVDWPKNILFKAIEMRFDKLMKLLLKGASEKLVKNKNLYRQTILEFIASPKMAQIVLNSKALPILLNDIRSEKDKGTYPGVTPLQYAVESGNVGVVEELLKNNDLRNLCLSKDFVASFKLDSQTPLGTASSKGFTDIVELLLTKTKGEEKKNLLIGGYSRFSMTPLHWAAAYGHAAVIKALLSDPDSLTKEILLSDEYLKSKRLNSTGSPLHFAAKLINPSAAETLLADPDAKKALLEEKNIRNNKGNTPLHIAVKNNSLGVIKVLLDDKDAREVLLDEKNIKNDDGDTPLDLSKSEQMTDLLKEYMKD